MNSPKQSAPANPVQTGLSVFRTMAVALFMLTLSIRVVAESSYSAVYTLQADRISMGKVERSLQQIGDGSFILKTRSYTTGFLKLFVDDTINEETLFAIVDGKVIPKNYHYTKKKKGKLLEERVVFNSGSGEIVSNFAEKRGHFPYTGAESDKLLYQFMIRAALKREPGVHELEFAVVDKGEIRPYQFKIGALESLTTDIGVIEAVRVERVNEAKRKTTIWFAPELDYLPVKIVQETGDHNFSSTILSISLRK